MYFKVNLYFYGNNNIFVSVRECEIAPDYNSRYNLQVILLCYL